MPWNIINSVKTVPNTKTAGFVGWIGTGNNSGNTKLARSNDGTTWTGLPYSWTSGGKFNEVAYGKDGAGNNLWVAVGDITGGQVATSSDGNAWIQKTTPVNGARFGIAYGKDGSGNGLWVSVGSGTNKIIISSDGNTWNPTSNNAFGATTVSKVAYGKDSLGNGLWIAVGEEKIARSTNGNTWTVITPSVLSSYNNIRYGKNGSGNGLWVVGGTGTIGSANIFASSTDGGNTWSGNGGKSNFFSVQEVSYGKDGSNNNLWVAGCNTLAATPNVLVARSLNGTTWDPAPEISIFTKINGLKYGKDSSGNSLWLAAGDGTGISFVKSSDGNNWSAAGGKTSLFSTEGIAIAFSEIIEPP